MLEKVHAPVDEFWNAPISTAISGMNRPMMM